jgi:hypothetical protein
MAQFFGFKFSAAGGVDVASLGLFKIDRSTQKLTTGRIHYSMFDVERSMFDVH